MNSYELSRDWFDWCFENPEKVNPNHVALYFFCIEHCNRLGWKDKFGLPTTMVKDAIGIRSYNTYSKTLNDLVEFGFISIIEKSKNQYSSNIIALLKNDKAIDKAIDKALDKALIKHATKQEESTIQSTSSIDKQYNQEQENNKTKNKEHILLEKESKFNVLDFLVLNGAELSLVKDWISVRKLKKLANTKTAMEIFIKEVKKSGVNINEVLRICVVKSWGGFESSWLENKSNQIQTGVAILKTEVPENYGW